MRVAPAVGLLFLLLVASSFAVEIGANVDSVRILSVSTLIDSDNSERRGSLNGGTRLYIKIVGHDSHVASNNSIFVGPYPCIIPEMGVNEVFITCITTPAYDNTKLWSLPVVVKVVNRSDSQCAQSDTSNCTFTYDGSKTPILDLIIPRSILPKSDVSWWGNFRIANTNQIDKMLVGNLLCDRYFLGLNEDEPYYGDSYDDLACQIDYTHPAGFYPASFISKPGKSINKSRLTTVRSTTQDTPYDVQVVSQQRDNANTDPQSISSNGGLISISASGIPKDTTNVAVSWNGSDCPIQSVQDTSFTCRIPAGLPTPTVDSTLRYESGSGVRLEIFNTTSWDLIGLKSSYSKNTLSNKTVDTIVPTTEYTFDYDGDDHNRQFYVFTGYFNPPRDGQYAFQTSSQYYAQVYLQTAGDSTDETSSTYVLINSIVEGTQVRDPYSSRFDFHNPTSESLVPSIQLKKGTAYYFKIYALGSSNNSFHHSTGVRIPTKPNPSLPQPVSYVNSLGQITRVKIDYQFTKEVITIAYKDRTVAAKTFFGINFIDPIGAQVKEKAKYWQTPSQQYGRDSTCDSISWHFKQYNGARNTCVQKDINNDSGVKIGSIWELTFQYHRYVIKPSFSYTAATTDAPVYTQVNPPGPNLSGTFRLKVNNDYVKISNSADIPFNTEDWTLNYAIQQMLGTTNIDSSRNGQFIDGAEWIFDFYGISSPVTVEVIPTESRLGGEPGKATPLVETLRAADSTILYYPTIETELLTQRSTQPYALVTVNGVKTIASQTNQQLIVKVLADADAVSYTGFTDDNTSTLVINGISSSSALTVSNFLIYYNGVQCTITTPAGTVSGSLTCTYPYKVAGTYLPEIYYQQKGYALAVSVTPKTTNPAISGLSSTTIYSFGGSDLTITGTFFPTALTSDLKVTVGSIQATILSVSNTSITVRTPGGLTSGSSADVQVTYKTFASNTSSIQVNNSGAITITGIDKSIVSPVDKTLITVTGTNFGSDKTKLAAYLDSVDANKNVVKSAVYQVNVVTASSTQVQILLGGGLPGQYKLRVVQIGLGSNDPTGAVDSIDYNIYLTNFSISTASAYGGATLEISGQNFSKTLTDNQVLVVYAANNSEFCIIQTATPTKLTCTLPNMISHLGADSTKKYEIQVWGKLIAQAVVQPGSGLVPSVTFDTSLAINVASIDKANQAYNGQATLTGTSIPASGQFSVVVIGYENTPVSIVSSTSTSVTYTTPNLPKGDYTVVLRQASGDSKPQPFSVYEMFYKLSTAQYTVSAAGAELNLVMSGNLPDQDPVFKFNNVQATLLSYDKTNGNVKVRLPPTTVGSGYKLLSVRSALVALQSDGTLPWTAHSTTFTVVAATATVTKVTVVGTDVQLTGTGLDTITSAYLQYPSNPKKTIASSAVSGKTATSATFSFATAPAGTYTLYLVGTQNNYPTISDSKVIINLASLSSPAVTSSYAGGSTLTITGSGFNTDTTSQNSVTICGNEAQIVSVTSSTLTVSTPAAYTSSSRTAYSFPANNNKALSGFTTFGNDLAGNSQYLGDGDLLFYYSNTQGGACYAGVNFGNARVVLSKFQLYPRSQGVTNASLFFGTIFQASVDGTTWVDLYTIGTDFHLGKNMYLIDSLISTTSDATLKANLSGAYSQFRISDSKGDSKCELVEIEVFGWKQSSVAESGNTLTCVAQVSVNGSPAFPLSNNVVYDKTKTFIVSAVSPSYGDINGGTAVTITLDRAPSAGAVPVVTIDGVVCASPSLSGLTITCTTAAKATTAPTTLVVTIDSYTAVNNGLVFYYGNLWSKDTTWGSDFPPIDGDLVYVTAGNNVIVDVPYVGVLNTVIVQDSTLIFANDKNIHFEAHNILVQGGNIVIGTAASPVTGSVRITMHGNEEDKQFPTVGNKGLSVHDGSIDIHGKKRAVTWTELSSTADVGATSITVSLKDPAFDWAVGEEIVIASTDYSHGHAERRIITAITKTSSTATITFQDPLLVKHISVTDEPYKGGSIKVSMKAEVGLLTRNVVFEGNAASTIKSYGAHIMLHGAKTSARIRYAEFTKTGQPSIIGRYPIHFHMVGDVTGSIVEGNAVHDSFARVLTIHATHYLQVRNNVGYNCAGHNIFLEDGIETNNVIEQNLIIGTKQVWSMLQSDITAASYWITNPLNTVINNRAAGGDFYGFWYEIKEHPDGPSARNDICPQGMALGKFDGNVAHSYDRFGLRIFVLTNLQNPCNPYRKDTKANPFIDNPSFPITWSNFVSYRNHEDGVLAEEVGNMIFDNFKLLDNKQSGFNAYLTNRTDEEVILRNSLVVGKSANNYGTPVDLNFTRGIITPRTDGFRVENTHFANFDGTMTVFKSCSFCWHFKKWVQGGKLTKFLGISYENIQSNYIFWEQFRREIYQDLDGSLSQKGTPQWITPTGAHLVNQAACSTTSGDSDKWDQGLICNKQVVRIEFSNPEKFDELYTKALYVQPCDAQGVPQGYKNDTDTDFYRSQTVKIKNHGNDLKFGFVGTFLAGSIFSVQWEVSAIDFTHMSVQLSPWHNGGSTAADTIVLRFPYTDFRETWDIYQMIANQNNKDPYLNVTTTQDTAALDKIKALNCKHGDWYNDLTGRAMYLCLNGNGRAKATTNQYLERTDVNAIKCRLNCPLPPGKCVKDGVKRYISTISTWQGIKLDSSNTGDIINVAGNSTLAIPCPWEVVVDQDLTQFSKIIVEGTLRIDPSKDIKIQADGIWIKGGTIIAEGDTAGNPYTKQLTITLTGNRDQPTQFLIDNTIEVGNKVIVNTGSFILRGVPPTATAPRLAVSTKSGDTTITVTDATGWKVGDTIAVAPTQLDATEHEQFAITAITGNVVTLDKAVQFYHFGASSVTLSETWGSYVQQLDLRAQVVHLTRNIKIQGGPVTSGIQWGCRVLNFYWQIVGANGVQLPPEKQLHLRGVVDWNGVEMDNCGQADTVRGALDFQLCGSDDDNKVPSVVNNSAIHNCAGYCSNIEQSSFITISNTNFYNGRPILMRINQVNNIAISNNHFVAAIKRDYQYDVSHMIYDMNAAIYYPTDQDSTVDNILINNNQIQGSQGPCFVVPHTTCDNASNISSTVGIFGNQASTCLIGAMFKVISTGCQWAGKVAVARATKGIMVNPTRPGIIVEHVLAAESDRSVILRFANEGSRNYGQFQNSAIYGVAITNDSTAYDSDKKADVCRNTSGTQNLVVTRGGEDFPLKVMPLAFDVICNSEVFDSSLYQTNVKYVRFRKTYSNANYSKCGNNHMMATHPSASDATAGTYNSGVTCEDCAQEAYFNFMSPNPAWNGWFGGCGLFLCTGPENVLNVDFTGDLFSGVPTTGISHNDGIANKQQCTKQPNWNDAYSCTGTEYVQLEWESQAADKNKRSTAPVMLTSLDGTYSNKINMFREWEWDGNEPMNLRDNRYLATARVGTVYKVEYNGLNPYNLFHRIQQRSADNIGEPKKWIIFTSTYQVPMNIEISIDGGNVIESYLPTDNIDLTTKSNICGANVYDWTTRTVQFVITGAADCLLRAVVLDTVRIHVKVVLKVEEFFSNDNKVSFISKVASFLQITDYSRIKVVGANTTGNRFLQGTSAPAPSFDLVIDITSKPTDNSKQDPAVVFKSLTDKAESLKKALDSNSVPGLNSNTYYVTSYDVSVGSDTNGGIYGKNTNTTPIAESSSSSSDSTLAIILGVVIGLVVITIAVVGYCAYKRYQQRKSLLVQQADIDHSIENPAPHRETAKVHPIALDPANDQLQEKANCSSAPFQS